MSWLFDASICLGAAAPQTTWTFAPLLVLPLLATAWLYAIGTRRLWRRTGRTHPLRSRQALLFAAGWMVLAAALVSPLHALSERLFAAHMMEHLLIMSVAAPLIAAAAPGGAMLWALPRRGRQVAGRLLATAPVVVAWQWLSRPVLATILHGLAIWIWHVPGLFEAALARGALHYVQHASFLATGLLFWWVMLRRRGAEPRLGASVMHLFVTSLHTSVLGVLLVLSPRLWYPANTGLSEQWGLTPLEDQQLAGLIMWVPAGLIYGLAALLLAGLWIKASGGAQRALQARGAARGRDDLARAGWLARAE